MKVFAQWIKARPEDSDNEDYFRKNTILQFGNSWNVIGAAILINPGSALPSEEIIDSDTKSKLQEISNTYSENEDWRVFNADPTMHFIEKIFSGWYIGQNKHLDGVILLYNLFNIRSQNLKTALALKEKYKQSPYMFTKPADVTTLDIPIYLGWGNIGKTELAVIDNNSNNKSVSESLFESLKDQVSYYTGCNFDKALFYHPQYINRSYHNPITQNLLHRFLRLDGEVTPQIIFNENVCREIIDEIKTYIEDTKIVNGNEKNKLSFKVCKDRLVCTIVLQKNKERIILQHAEYNKKRTYRDYSSDYENVDGIREILYSHNYDISFASSLGEKSLKVFTATNIEDTSKIIREEIQEISDLIEELYQNNQMPK